MDSACRTRGVSIGRIVGGRAPVLPRWRLILLGTFARRAHSSTLLLQAGFIAMRAWRNAFFLVRFVVGGEPAAPPDLDGALAADGRKSMSRAPRPAFTQLPGRKP
jgi:hypothetical protein